MSEKLNIYQKMQAVSNEVKNIEKNLTVKTGGDGSYKAVGDLDVMLAVKKAETEFKLYSYPFKQEVIHSEVLRMQGDKYKFLDQVKMTIRIVDLEEPTSFVDVESFGTGLDAGDKGFGKASTYARKYGLLNAYKIPTGVDPDADPSDKKDKLEEKPDAEKIAVQNYANKDNKYLQSILTNFSVGNFNDLTKEQIHITYNTLKQKKLI